MAYIDIFNAVNDPTFQGRCTVALWVAAKNISEESPQTANYRDRQNWARTAYQGKLALTSADLAKAVLRNPAIAANPGAASDSDIQFQVNSLIGWIIAQG